MTTILELHEVYFKATGQVLFRYAVLTIFQPKYHITTKPGSRLRQIVEQIEKEMREADR